MLLCDSSGACPIGQEFWVFFEHEQVFSEFAKLFLKECELWAVSCQLSLANAMKIGVWNRSLALNFSKKICDIPKKEEWRNFWRLHLPWIIKKNTFPSNPTPKCVFAKNTLIRGIKRWDAWKAGRDRCRVSVAILCTPCRHDRRLAE